MMPRIVRGEGPHRRPALPKGGTSIVNGQKAVQQPPYEMFRLLLDFCAEVIAKDPRELQPQDLMAYAEAHASDRLEVMMELLREWAVELRQEIEATPEGCDTREPMEEQLARIEAAMS